MNAPLAQAQPVETTPQHLTLSEYLKQVSKVIRQAMPDSTWVVAELSDFKRRSNGHVYMDIIESQDGKEVAKTRVAMFATVSGRVLDEWQRVTGGLPQPGMKVLLKVRAELSPQYGFSLNATGLDPSYTLGDMQAKLQEVISPLKSKGWFDMQRALAAPTGHWRVAVISPQEAAGLADFKRDAQLLDDAGVCQFDYFSAVFQGKESSESIRNALRAAYERHQLAPYDALCIIRGGGAKADLAHLNDGTLGAWVCRVPIPVYTGIGHEIDECLLDMVAHRKFDTPSKVIGYIKTALIAEASRVRADLQVGASQMLALANGERPHLERQWGAFSRLARTMVHAQHQHALTVKGRVDMALGRLIGEQRMRLERRSADLQRLGTGLSASNRQRIELQTGRAHAGAQAVLVQNRNALSLACTLYDKTNPLALLGRGFALVRGSGGEILSSAAQVRAAREVSLTFADGVVRVQPAEGERGVDAPTQHELLPS